MRQPLLGAAHDAQRQIKRGGLVFELLGGLLLHRGLDRRLRVRAIQIVQQSIAQMRMQTDHVDVAAVLRAVGAVIRADRPGVQHGAVAVEEMHLRRVQQQPAVTAVQRHRLGRQPTHTPKMLHDRPERGHHPRGVIVGLDRALRVGHAVLDGDPRGIQSERQRSTDRVVSLDLQRVGNHRIPFRR